MTKQSILLTVLLLIFVGSGLAEIPPVETVDGVALPGVSTKVTDRRTKSSGKAAKSKSAKAKPVTPIDKALYTDTRIGLLVEPGTTEVVPMARNYMNRIITPFENPKLITANDIVFKKEGSSVFVTTQSEAPVGIHILSNDASDTRSISLALVPKAIPPRTIHLKWPGQF
ncbi:MAG: hypothetical protein ACR2PS_13870, partial [Pseudomonadales bacterium]